MGRVGSGSLAREGRDAVGERQYVVPFRRRHGDVRPVRPQPVSALQCGENRRTEGVTRPHRVHHRHRHRGYLDAITVVSVQTGAVGTESEHDVRVDAGATERFRVGCTRIQPPKIFDTEFDEMSGPRLLLDSGDLVVVVACQGGADVGVITDQAFAGGAQAVHAIVDHGSPRQQRRSE